MPQMYPLMWFTLFSSATLALIVVMSILHFSFEEEKSKKEIKSNKELKNFTWKW